MIRERHTGNGTVMDTGLNSTAMNTNLNTKVMDLPLDSNDTRLPLDSDVTDTKRHGSGIKTISMVLAFLTRVLSVPPFMAALLVLILAIARPGTFIQSKSPGFMLLFLAFLPLLSYPLSAVLPNVRKRGREGQRNLAFILCAAGYLGGWLYSLFCPATKEEQTIYLTYLLSVILLLIFNKLFKIRASGHACSVTGPVVFGILFFPLPGLIIGILMCSLIVWSSLALKRHTLRELGLGALLCILAAFLSYLMIRPELFL